MNPLLPDNGIRLSRRRFVTGLAAGGAALACGRLLAADGPVSVPELAGERFALRIGYQRVNFTGVERLATPSTAACRDRCCTGAKAINCACG